MRNPVPGGALSDSPIEHAADGVAAAGGSVPALITLGSWGSATLLSASGWQWSKASVAPAWNNSGYSTGWVLMSATQWLNVMRKQTDNSVQYGVLTLDAAGDIDTENACAALSDFTTNGAPVLVRKVPGSSTRVVIASGKTTSTVQYQWREYDLSGSTLTGQNSLQTQDTAGGGAGDFRGFFMELFGSDYGLIGGFPDSGSMGAYPFKFSATQSVGSLVDTGTISVSSQDQGGALSWKSQLTSNVAYCSSGELTKWVLTEAGPPTMTETSQTGVDNLGSWCYGLGASMAHRGLIVQPPTEATDGNVVWITRLGLGYWAGEGNEIKMAGHTSNHGVNLGGFGEKLINAFSRHNLDFVQVDTSGDWVRGVLILCHTAAGTTGLTAIPLNVNPKDARFVPGTPSQTTNITPASNNPINFGAAYHADWTTSQIQIAIEDGASAPSVIALAITVT